MTPQNPIRAFYETHPRMVSSPFGGIDGIDAELFGAVLDRLGIPLQDQRVLDVGCGRGHAETVVRARGGRYFGADFAISAAGFPLAQADAAYLPFPDAAFDVVLCVDAFEHIPDMEAAAREFHRVLRHGGHFFLSAPNYGNVAGLVKWYCERFGGYAAHSWAPFGRWQPQEFEQALTPGRIRPLFVAEGFTELYAIGHGPDIGLGIFPWMDHPKMPEAIQYRLQRFFQWAGPPLARILPTLSLHLFWRMRKKRPSSSSCESC